MTEKRRCVIVTGGSCGRITPLEQTDFVIACDHGYQHTKDAGVKPALVLGDFDSYTDTVEDGIDVLRYQKEKDDTDTLIAIRYALEHGFDDLLVYGAFGGRLDHLYANFQAAAFAAQQGALCHMKGEENELYALKDRALHLRRRDGYSFSLFSHSDSCPQVSASGLRYPVENLSLTNTFPIGVSNEFAGNEVSVETTGGILFVLLSRLPEKT